MIEKIVEKGWYRLELGGRQRFTGQCIRITHGVRTGGHRSFTFNLGTTENKTRVGMDLLMIRDDDVKSAVRLSPRYIEQIETHPKPGATRIRFKGIFVYGEE